MGGITSDFVEFRMSIRCRGSFGLSFSHFGNIGRLTIAIGKILSCANIESTSFVRGVSHYCAMISYDTYKSGCT
jgi:hypothetical protein